MKTLLTVILFISATILCSCKKYLDAKPDASLTTPSSLSDLQTLLDNYSYLNAQFVGSGEILSDNFYLTNQSWAALSRSDQRNYYIWQADDNNNLDWNQAYRVVYTCNLVLEYLKKISLQPEDQQQADAIEGSALFFRASYFYSIAQLFARDYNAQTASSDLGIPLRLTTDIQAKSTRSSISETYERIIEDFKSSVRYLPLSPLIKTRPSLAAAYGGLARAYLSMGDYQNADLYADSCLHLNNILIDYNSLNTNAAIPFPMFNDEVIFQATTYPIQPLTPAVCLIDSVLYKSYDSNDLRKTIYFKPNPGGTYTFKGNYDGNRYNGQTFVGIATDEQYLIKAECEARLGNAGEALRFINLLLENRFTAGTYTPFTSTDPDSLLSFILQERRKELIFRSARLTDLKRLNQSEKYAVTLHRVINNTDYFLKPQDVRYVELIPHLVIQMSGIQQNP